MTTILDITETVYPSNDSTGIPLNNTIQILFDREIDEWSIEHGGLILEGPDTDLVIYPGYTPTTLVAGTESEILQSPGLMGIVPGTYEFQRISLTSTNQVHLSDTTGDGALFRTKVIFKPSFPLRALTKYYGYIVGDDDAADEEILGLRTRTVFDPISNGGNTGTGSITFSGTYLGNLTQDTINIRITTAGVTGEAEFEAWRTSQPLDLIGPFKTSSSECQVLDGVTVQFIEGMFEVGDEFTVLVKKPEILAGTVTFSFTTGNGSIAVVPTTTSTSITGDPLLTDTSNIFKVLKTVPVDGATNLLPSPSRRISVKFNNEIDPASVTSETVQVLVEPVIDHPLLSTSISAGPISHTVTVSGVYLLIDL